MIQIEVGNIDGCNVFINKPVVQLVNKRIFDPFNNDIKMSSLEKY